MKMAEAITMNTLPFGDRSSAYAMASLDGERASAS